MAQRSIKVVVWNVQADQRTQARSARIRARLAKLNADVMCLNEAFPDDVLGIATINSELSDWHMEARGARKVILASRSGWEQADSVGSSLLPEGRFATSVVNINGAPVRVIGIAPPYHAYRASERWGERRRKIWQGNVDYWRALSTDIMPHICAPALMLGDFNVQFPPRNYPRPGSDAFMQAEATLSGWRVATAGIEVDGRTLDKPLVCHIAHTPDFTVVDQTILSRFDEDGLELSDHPCICLTLQL